MSMLLFVLLRYLFRSLSLSRSLIPLRDKSSPYDCVTKGTTLHTIGERLCGVRCCAQRHSQRLILERKRDWPCSGSKENKNPQNATAYRRVCCTGKSHTAGPRGIRGEPKKEEKKNRNRKKRHRYKLGSQQDLGAWTRLCNMRPGQWHFAIAALSVPICLRGTFCSPLLGGGSQLCTMRCGWDAGRWYSW